MIEKHNKLDPSGLKIRCFVRNTSEVEALGRVGIELYHSYLLDIKRLKKATKIMMCYTTVVIGRELQ